MRVPGNRRNFLMVHPDHNADVIRGLASPVRIDILGLLHKNGPLNVNDIARSLGVPMFMANVSLQIYEMAKAAGLGKKDGAAVVTIYEKMADVKLGPRQDG